MHPDLHTLAHLDFGYLTTTGRVTGKPHTIEIWFAMHDRTVYMLAGNHASDWVKNARRTPNVSMTIGGFAFVGTARIVDQAEEDALARRLILAKYQPGYGEDLSDWGRTALAVAVDLNAVSETRPGML
ncbi:MAG: nitroreductase family deazaflavin-dependent oxidoreductase [Roseiflexus castenholzii]|uniref:nitroreductase family deazaflavin-dependent oxidoreductase n=1 Tax=Roseiflexus castenholzii TaxID=120962 RepID=UPI000CB99BD7|nr:MAG: nitroreductase family deazaflavin-dependent oxidoreductase [Roseiflexus castenholzii]